MPRKIKQDYSNPSNINLNEPAKQLLQVLKNSESNNFEEIIRLSQESNVIWNYTFKKTKRLIKDIFDELTSESTDPEMKNELLEVWAKTAFYNYLFFCGIKQNLSAAKLEAVTAINGFYEKWIKNGEALILHWNQFFPKLQLATLSEKLGNRSLQNIIIKTKNSTELYIYKPIYTAILKDKESEEYKSTTSRIYEGLLKNIEDLKPSSPHEIRNTTISYLSSLFSLEYNPAHMGKSISGLTLQTSYKIVKSKEESRKFLSLFNEKYADKFKPFDLNDPSGIPIHELIVNSKVALLGSMLKLFPEADLQKIITKEMPYMISHWNNFKPIKQLSDLALSTQQDNKNYFDFLKELPSFEGKELTEDQKGIFRNNFRTYIDRYKLNINAAIDPATGNTLLHQAAQTNNALLVNILLEIPGIELNCLNNANLTPAEIAQNNGDTEVAGIILDKMGMRNAARQLYKSARSANSEYSL